MEDLEIRHNKTSNISATCTFYKPNNFISTDIVRPQFRYMSLVLHHKHIRQYRWSIHLCFQFTTIRTSIFQEKKISIDFRSLLRNKVEPEKGRYWSIE